MGKAETFHGYAPDLGYEFLRNAIAENDYKARGCDIAPDEIFVSDGAKCDCGNIQEIFSLDNKIAVCDPVYPVYVDSNVMAGRTGTYDPKSETWSDVIYMPCLAENGFAPKLPKETPDLIYLCFPNNPTGAAITKAQLQEWVDYDLVPRKHVDPVRELILRHQTDITGHSWNEYTDLLFVGSPSDLGLLAKAAPWVIYKRNTTGDWAQFSEVFGMPIQEYICLLYTSPSPRD